MSVYWKVLMPFTLKRVRAEATTTTQTRENSSNYPQTRKKNRIFGIESKIFKTFFLIFLREVFLLGSRGGRGKGANRWTGRSVTFSSDDETEVSLSIGEIYSCYDADLLNFEN